MFLVRMKEDYKGYNRDWKKGEMRFIEEAQFKDYLKKPDFNAEIVNHFTIKGCVRLHGQTPEHVRNYYFKQINKLKDKLNYYQDKLDNLNKMIVEV